MLKHFLLLASSLCFIAQARAASVPACFAQGGFSAHGAQVKSAREIELAGKDILLLAGIEVPPLLQSRAQARLAALIEKKDLRYAPLDPAPDRYGRIIAEAAAKETWLQGTLVEEGLALAQPLGLKNPCCNELMALEQKARTNKAGAWAQPESVQLAATDSEALKKAAGQFAVVEGKVLSVGERDYAIFLNFGKNYRQDFAVMVLKKHRAAFEAKQALTALQGKRVRVRGIMEAKAAPRLRLEEPEAMEVLE